jgi:hypothetical protein
VGTKGQNSFDQVVLLHAYLSKVQIFVKVTLKVY